MFVLNTFGALSLHLDGRPVTGSLSQKRKLALLAVLAAAGNQGVSRERIAVLLWPDSDTESARHSLSQLLYSLRRTLPDGAVTATGGNLALDPKIVSSDVADFDLAIRKPDREAAAALYHGPFLQGFHLPAAVEFEEWRVGEAAKRARQTIVALHSLITEAQAEPDFGRAVQLLTRLAALEPLDSKVAVLLMRALDATGNRPGAIQYAAFHESMVRDQLGIPPDPAVASLVDELRRKQSAHASRDAKQSSAAPEALSPLPVLGKNLVSDADVTVAEPHLSWRQSLSHWPPRISTATTVAVVIVLLAAAVVRNSRSSASAAVARTEASALAVLPFSYEGDSGSAYLGEGVVALMSTNLDGAGELRAVNPRAVLSFTHQSTVENSSAEHANAVASHFNANLFLLGHIAEAGGKLRITASLYERTPALRIVASAAVDGRTAALFSALDALTTELLAKKYSRVSERLTQTAARTTFSVPALKAHILGERLFRDGKYAEAVDAFQTAVTYDSTFALAFYRLAIASEFAQHLDLGYRAAEKAVAHSQRLSEHDRKLVYAYGARRHGNADEAERLYEEILFTHPDDVEAWFQLGEVLFHHNANRGRSFVESKRAWEHVLALNPSDHFALVHLARVLAREGNSPRLENVISRSIATAAAADKAELRCFRAFTVGTSADRDSSIAELRAGPVSAIWQSVWRVGVYPHNLNGAETLARVIANDDLSSARSLGDVGLMLIMFGRGRVRDAGTYGSRFVQPIPWSQQVPSPQFIGLGFSSVDSGAVRDLRERLMDWKAPRLSIDSGAGVSYEQLRDHQRRYLVGLLSVRLGDTNAALAAAKVLDTMQTISDARGLSQMFATAIRADLALNRGKPGEALRLLEHDDATVPIELSSPFGVEAYTGWLRAEALRLLNRDREALSWYASRVDRFVVELPYLGPAELRQAQAYERLGDKTRAREHYKRFVTLWDAADPEFQPMVMEARARLAALE